MKKQLFAYLCLVLGCIGVIGATRHVNHTDLPHNKKELSMQERQNFPSIVFGMGCFWGAEKRMQQLTGVVDVEAGYAGGDDPHPSYRSVLTHEKQLAFSAGAGKNHAEVVRVWYDPKQISLENVLARFWESHDPTQGNRQGNDEGSNYRSAIYYVEEADKATILETQKHYAAALERAHHPRHITTEIAPLKNYAAAEIEHQDYLAKNPNGYCGLGGLSIPYTSSTTPQKSGAVAQTKGTDWTDTRLNNTIQLIAFESEECGFCEKFNAEVVPTWKHPISLITTTNTTAPQGWHLASALFATPTIVLFKEKKEVARFTGYSDAKRFWAWFGQQTLTDAQKKIAFENGTEQPFTGSLLDEKRPGVFADPVTRQPLFRSGTKFNSHSGWPSFFDPIEGAVTYHTDTAHGTTRTEVRSASSGIHLGHVFNDGPPPTGKRYCINSDVLVFIPDTPTSK